MLSQRYSIPVVFIVLYAFSIASWLLPLAPVSHPITPEWAAVDPVNTSGNPIAPAEGLNSDSDLMDVVCTVNHKYGEYVAILSRNPIDNTSTKKQN